MRKCIIVFLVKPKKTVDIIIAAKNESPYIGCCLDSLLLQSSKKYTFELNIIVVDNGSIDGTPEVAKSRTENVFCKPELTLAEVRNFGVTQGNGEYLAFIDADCSCATGWLDSAISFLEVDKAGAVGGPCSLPERTTLVERAWVGRGIPKMLLEVDELATSSFITKRDTFEQVGGFNSSLGAGEDTDLSLKIRQQVGRLVRLNGCRVVHYGYPKTFLEFCKREYWHGLWEARRTQGRSKILLVSYIFVTLILVTIVALFLRMEFFSFVAFLLLFSLPVKLTWKKRAKSEFMIFSRESCVLLLLNFVYLLVRATAGIYVALKE